VFGCFCFIVILVTSLAGVTTEPDEYDLIQCLPGDKGDMIFPEDGEPFQYVIRDESAQPMFATMWHLHITKLLSSPLS
jgi:hypothetical protein